MSLAGAVRRLRLVSLAARSRCRLAASVSCRAASPSSLRRRAARAKRYQVGVAGDGAGLAELADGRQRRPGTRLRAPAAAWSRSTWTPPP
jgi:hypothetical protein